MHELTEEEKAKKPVNPNIPNARGNAAEEEKLANTEQGQLLSLEEIMNPFVDRGGAAFGAIVMATVLITVVVLNAVSTSSHEHPVYWVTLPGAFVMFCWDLAFGWLHRHETREIARKGREEVKLARALREEEAQREQEERDAIEAHELALMQAQSPEVQLQSQNFGDGGHNNPDAEYDIKPTADNSSFVSTPRLDSSMSRLVTRNDQLQNDQSMNSAAVITNEKQEVPREESSYPPPELLGEPSSREIGEKKEKLWEDSSSEVPQGQKRMTLVSLIADRYRWSQETFPTVTAVVAHLPFALVPFAFSMFVLVQALVTKGWVAVFAYGWDHWINQTGTVGAIGGMGFLSVILCNVSL